MTLTTDSTPEPASIPIRPLKHCLIPPTQTYIKLQSAAMEKLKKDAFERSSSENKSSDVIVQLFTSPSLIELSVFRIPPIMMRELVPILPAFFSSNNSPSLKDTHLLCIPTFQPCFVEVSKVSIDSELEKNRLLEVFYEFSNLLIKLLSNKCSFIDYIDPCSGSPVRTIHGSSTYSEVDGAQLLLKYKSEQIGFCSVIQHPKWKTNCYPASIFTNATVGQVYEAIETICQQSANVATI